MPILLYTRRGCHLCEVAEDMLSVLCPEARLIDVDTDPDAAACFGLRVPVLEVDGEPVLEGRFEEGLLAARLAAAGILRGPAGAPGDRADRPGPRPT